MGWKMEGRWAEPPLGDEALVRHRERASFSSQTVTLSS